MNEFVASLTIDMQLHVQEMIVLAERHFAVHIHPYCGLRTCEEQAKTFRATRTLSEIESKARSLSDKGFPQLAHVLTTVGPQSGTLGQHLTKAGPGESWHQYAQAVDCVPIVNGKAIWSDKDAEGARLWEIYGSCAEFVGLNWSGRWTRFKETAHCQLSPHSNPLNAFRDEDTLLASLSKAKSL